MAFKVLVSFFSAYTPIKHKKTSVSKTKSRSFFKVNTVRRNYSSASDESPIQFSGGGEYQMQDSEGKRKKSASQGRRETCACLKLSARAVPGDRAADLLNNSDPVRALETGNLWLDLQDLLL